MRELRSEMGRVGGRASTPAKASAARENGRKGGRPRKHPVAADPRREA
jgi:general stress protein YciG